MDSENTGINSGTLPSGQAVTVIKKPITIRAMRIEKEAHLLAAEEKLGIPATECFFKEREKEFQVKSKEGVMSGSVGDVLMKGVQGEVYICEWNIFKKSYRFASYQEMENRKK